MRILFLTHAFNSLTQRLYVELSSTAHQISIEFDINDVTTMEAVKLFKPDLILAPYLRRAIPESIWRKHVCLIVHPGIVGDRGPSALDWAILNGESEWGVTVLQAEAEMDAGPVWASAPFSMRVARKSSLYRNEVTEAAVRAVNAAIDRFPEFRQGSWMPQLPAHAQSRGQWRPLMTQAERAIDWMKEDTSRILAKLNCSDGSPGVHDSLFEFSCYLYNAHSYPAHGEPGEVLGRAGEGIVRATVDGAVWIGHARRIETDIDIKLPVTIAFPQAEELTALGVCTPEILYEEMGDVGYLHFDFYNGAMGTSACERLLEAYEAARDRPTRLIVLMGGTDFFSNGMDLNRIEAAKSPADESWRNINAMDDLCQSIIETTSHLTVSALCGNAGAGGTFLARAADEVWARTGVILNPHYKNMGNLYGSEYWTYLLQKLVNSSYAAQILQDRLPMSTEKAASIGFVDAVFGSNVSDFQNATINKSQLLVESDDFIRQLELKIQRRAEDESIKPLQKYRNEELQNLQRNFYGFDPSYHVARHHFVRKTPHSWTPRHLAIHRDQNK